MAASIFDTDQTYQTNTNVQKRGKICSPVEADAAGEQLVELLHPAATAPSGPGPAPPPAGLTSTFS